MMVERPMKYFIGIAPFRTSHRCELARGATLELVSTSSRNERTANIVSF